MDKLEINRTLAHQNIQKSQQKQKESYQQDKHAQTFFIRDKILMKRMEMQHWHREKFSQKWKGPYYIHEKLDKGAYRLRILDGKLLKNSYNGDHLKLYLEDNKLELMIIIQN